MKRILCAMLCVLMIVALLVPTLSIHAVENTPVATATVGGQQFTVMSCNIRYSSGDSDEVSLNWVVGGNETNGYVYRVDNAIKVIVELSPDIIGFQEFDFTSGTDKSVLKDTRIHDALIAAGYGVIAPTHTATVSKTTLEMPSQTAIYYKTAIFEAVDAAGAQGYVEYTHHEPVGTETGEQLYVRVVGSNYTGSTMPLKTGTTQNGAHVKELCKNGEYAPATLTSAEIAAGNYLDLSEFHSGGSLTDYYTSIARVTFNEDGSLSYNNGFLSTKTYDGAYHTRSFLTATPGKGPGKSLTYGVLEHQESGQRLLMMSTHLSVWLTGLASAADDFTYELSKQWNLENAKELIATVEGVWAKFGHLPTIAVGDFNMGNDHPTYSILSETFDDSARLAPNAIYWEGTSFDLHVEAKSNPIVDASGNTLYDVRAFRDDKAPAPGYSIDHIFCSQGDLEVLSYNVLNDTPEQRVISDHYALLTTFVLPDVQAPACSHSDGIYRLEQSVTRSEEHTSNSSHAT